MIHWRSLADHAVDSVSLSEARVEALDVLGTLGGLYPGLTELEVALVRAVIQQCYIGIDLECLELQPLGVLLVYVQGRHSVSDLDTLHLFIYIRTHLSIISLSPLPSFHVFLSAYQHLSIYLNKRR